MTKRYDATLKQLVDARPADWLRLFGVPAEASFRVVDGDVSSVTAAADKVVRVDADPPYLVHMEFQSGADAALDRRVLFYNSQLRWKHGLPVRSVGLLLGPRAAHPRVTGRVAEALSPDQGIEFRYRLVRAWELDVEEVIAGGLGTLPLAPLTVNVDAVIDVFDRVERRVRASVPEAEAEDLLAATVMLSGVRHDRAVIAQLFQKVPHMEESVAYQMIMERGELKGERKVLLRIGRKRLGDPPPEVVAYLSALEDEERLTSLVDRVLDVSSWNELLASALSNPPA